MLKTTMFLFIAALITIPAACDLNAQDTQLVKQAPKQVPKQLAKVDPSKTGSILEVTPSTSTTSGERPLTKEEILDIQVSMLKIKTINDKFHIDEYKAAITPWSLKQQSIRDTLCHSIGIPSEHVNAECLITGIGEDGDPVTDPQGKPVQPKVVWNKPALQPEKK